MNLRLIIENYMKVGIYDIDPIVIEIADLIIILYSMGS